MPKIAVKTEEQIGAEAVVEDFRRELGPFVVAADVTRMAMVFTDAQADGDPIIFANESFLALTAYSREEVLGQPSSFLAGPISNPETPRKIEEAFATGSDGRSKVQLRRKDGTAFWAAMFVNPVRDKTGTVIEHVASFVDITPHKEEEERLRFLLDELNHRTQNTLATVQSIALQTLRGATDKGVLDIFEGRILALAKAHSLLGRENWQAVSLGEVLGPILEPFGLGEGADGPFSLVGEEVRLAPKMALSLAMAFHELATNAARYGALRPGGVGHIDVNWMIETTPDGRRLEISWEESGGPPVVAPVRKGFGSRLIEGALAHELDGAVHVDYAPAGLRCEIVMPLPRTGNPR